MADGLPTIGVPEVRDGGADTGGGDTAGPQRLVGNVEVASVASATATGDFGFGEDVMPLGDVDGDGVRDLWVKQDGYIQVHYAYGEGTENGEGPALGHLVSGAKLLAGDPGADLASWTESRYPLPPPRNAGDADGDGHDDVWMLLADDESRTYTVALVSGDSLLAGAPRTLSVPLSNAVAEEMSWSPAGDLDRDGAADVVIEGLESSTGYVAVQGSAARGGLTRDDARTLVTWDVATDHAYGAELALVGDADGDGVDDVIVSVLDGQGGGRTWLFGGDLPSGQIALRDLPVAIDAWVRSPVADLGDVDGDGLPDVGGYPGVWLGGPSAWQATPDLRRPVYGPAGDLDGDGLADGLTVRSSYWPMAFVEYRLLGDEATATVNLVAPTYGADPSVATWGLTARAVGDLDGDGRDDLVLAAPAWETQSQGSSTRDYAGPGTLWFVPGSVF